MKMNSTRNGMANKSLTAIINAQISYINNILTNDLQYQITKNKVQIIKMVFRYNDVRIQ